MKIIEGQEVIDEELLPPGRHVAEETWEEYGVRYIYNDREETEPSLNQDDARYYSNQLNGQVVKRTVVALAWETATE